MGQNASELAFELAFCGLSSQNGRSGPIFEKRSSKFIESFCGKLLQQLSSNCRLFVKSVFQCFPSESPKMAMANDSVSRSKSDFRLARTFRIRAGRNAGFMTQKRDAMRIPA